MYCNGRIYDEDVTNGDEHQARQHLEPIPVKMPLPSQLPPAHLRKETGTCGVGSHVLVIRALMSLNFGGYEPVNVEQSMTSATLQQAEWRPTLTAKGGR